MRTSAGWRLIASQVLALRADPPPIQLAAHQIQEYVGRYTLAQSKVYEIRIKDGTLEGQETGRPPEALQAEVVNMLFVPGKPRYRKVFLRDSNGHVSGFAERREAWDLIWKRLPE
jgi:hypothetical protein